MLSRLNLKMSDIVDIYTKILTKTMRTGSFAFTNDPIGEGAYDFSKHHAEIGLSTIDYENDVSDEIFVSGLMAVYHESRHENQRLLFLNGDHNKYVSSLALDAIGNQFNTGYYTDAEQYNHNYRLMFHEIDAEKNAFMSSYSYLVNEMKVDSDYADELVTSVINEKRKGLHWLSFEKFEADVDEKYKSNAFYSCADNIVEAFDVALENSKEQHRIINLSAMTKTKDDSKSIKKLFYRRDPEAFKQIADELNGMKQSEMIANVWLKFKPSLRKEFRCLDNYDLSDNHCFGRKVNIRPVNLKERLLSLATYIDLESDANNIGKDDDECSL